MVSPRPFRVYYPYYLQLLKTFRNGWRMIPAFRVGAPFAKAVFWDGTTLVHPPGRAGLIETIIEVWMMSGYTKEDWETPFYTPGDGDVILDVGANVGLFSVWLARRNPRCRIVALEPFEENFRYLQANIRSTRSEAVEAHQLALGASYAKGKMIAVGDRSLDHLLSLDAAGHGDQAVSVVPLGGLLQLAKADRVAFLKVDVEGAEYDAFAQATPEILDRFDRIAIEYHDNIRPGTLELLKERMAPTHNLIHCSPGEDFGILLGNRRAA